MDHPEVIAAALGWVGVGLVVATILQRKYVRLNLRYCEKCRRFKIYSCQDHDHPGWFLLGLLLPPVGVAFWFTLNTRQHVLELLEREAHEAAVLKELELHPEYKAILAEHFDNPL